MLASCAKAISVVLKIDAYNYQEYGTAEGTVLWISENGFSPEQAVGRAANRRPGSAADRSAGDSERIAAELTTKRGYRLTNSTS